MSRLAIASYLGFTFKDFVDAWKLGRVWGAIVLQRHINPSHGYQCAPSCRLPSRFSTEGAIAEIRKSAEEFWRSEAILDSEVLHRGLAAAFVAEKYYDGVNINKRPGNSAVTAPLLPARLWLELTKTCVPTAFLECEFAQEHMSVDFESYEDLLRSIAIPLTAWMRSLL